MRTLYKSLLTTLLFTATLPSIAQLSPVWSAEVGAVQWMRTTSAGALVACTPEGLKGIDPANGTVSWTVNDLASAPENAYEEVANTPFITVAPNGKPDDLLIVEPFSGTVVFNSAETGISRIVNKYFLYANKVIILVGQKADKTAAMACVDMVTGKVRWTKDDKFSRLLACNSVSPDALLLSTLFFAYKIDTNTGEELWKKSPDPGFEKMAGLAALLDKGGANLGGLVDGISGLFLTTPFAPGQCFMGMQSMTKKTTTDSQGNKKEETIYKTFVNAFDINDGSYAWAEPMEMNQMLGTIIPMESGLLVGAGNKRSVDLLNYKTGAGIWGKKGKGIKVKGILSGAVSVGDKTLLTSGGDDGVISLVDALGVQLWKKPVKLAGVVRSVSIMQDELLLASAEEVEVVELTTGISRLSKSFKGGSELVSSGGGTTYIFNTKDGLLYSIPKGGGTVKAVSTVALKFEGKEKPTAIEYTDKGLVISSDQNLALLGIDGKLHYQKYFAAPRESGLVRALKYASAVRAAYYTAAFGYTSAAFGAASQSIEVTDANSALGRDLTGAVSDVYAEGSQVAMSATKRFMQEANARFKATTSTNTIHYMMSVAGKNTFALQALKKEDGSQAGTIPLGKDKSPRYEVDGFTNTVYLAEGNVVKCFKL